MSIELPFDPFPLFSGSHQQTIFGSLPSFQFQPPSSRKLIELPDKDRISLEITTPKNWNPSDPTVIMLHGLCGSHKSSYLVRITKKLAKTGIRSVRFNLRGCGSGRGLAKGIYHCGRSDDVLVAIKELKKEFPESPIILIGFSIGGSIVLKLAGELGEEAKKYLVKVIGINAPIDIKKSLELLSHPKNRFYERYFSKKLYADVEYRHKRFPELGKHNLPKDFKLHDFDKLYTVPQGGFNNLEEYYLECSAVYKVQDITIDCNILASQDDPIIYPNTLDDMDLPPNIRYYKTKKGGHLGYIGKKHFHWIDQVALDWINECF